MAAPIKCKAAVAYGYNQPLSIETVTVAPPEAGEVRIKIAATALCHSDAHFVWREMPEEAYPYVLGHEAAGIVESVGEGVTSVKLGDKVVLCFLCQCGDCRYCKDPRTNLCGEFPDDLGYYDTYEAGHSSRITLKDGKLARQFAGTSTFSEYTVTPEIQVAKVRDDAPLETVCLTSCGIPTGYGAAVNVAKVQAGSTCAVWGLGTIGLAAVMGCKARGAKTIFGVDINPDKEAKARELGITEFLNPLDYDKPIQEVIKEKTDGGLDYAIECIGAAKCVEAALESVRRGVGLAVVVGLVESKLTLSAENFLMGKTLHGCYYGGYKSRESIPKLVDDYMAGNLNLEAFITNRMDIEDINEAFDLLKAGKSFRSVMTFGK
ncbi:alcohol dehydrogenase class-3-like [Lineus longissimus]|uniref:alcohol dehydrogenase class-3-like n=1 Tax=Lineus longissimus TaxID=88925 RepID=UPI002B4FA6F3